MEAVNGRPYDLLNDNTLKKYKFDNLLTHFLQTFVSPTSSAPSKLSHDETLLNTYSFLHAIQFDMLHNCIWKNHNVNPPMCSGWTKILIQYNLNGSNTDGSFTVDDSNPFFSPYKILPINSSRKQIFRDFFLFYHGIVCCVYSLELPH